jgi:peptidoglycan/xylan/chitin deacetylase (PgdA/CDA1 family)/glycosyltransferase involved in cell wall biosynthesis
MKLSVVIATHDRRAVLERTLPGVLGQDFPPEDYEVVVVVDGSNDGTADLLDGATARARCSLRFAVQTRQGQPAAQNVGLRMARGERVLFLDDDILIGPTLLAEHWSAHETGRRRCAFGPIFNAPSGNPTLADDLMRLSLEEEFAAIARKGPRLSLGDVRMNANTSAPRDVLLAVGGFAPELSPLEHVDLALRLVKAGVEFHYVPRAVVHQIYVKMASSVVHRDAVRAGRAEVLLCRRHPEYRPHSQLGALSEGSALKRVRRWVAIRSPLSPELVLSPLFRLCELARRVPRFRRWGMRLLQFRRGVALFRSAARELGSWRKLHGEFGVRLPVLLYHHVGPRRKGTIPTLTVTPREFERQIRLLWERGYTAIRPETWVSWCKGEGALPEKPFLISFDDGYRETADYAYPVLERYGFPSVTFVPTSYVGRTSEWDAHDWPGKFHALLDAREIAEHATGGIGFGAHSRSHPDLRTTSATELLEQVQGSGEDLRRILGKKATTFAYPYGFNNEDARRCVAANFDLGFGLVPGVNTVRTDPACLFRTMIWPEDTLLDVWFTLQLGLSPVHRLRGRLRREWQRWSGARTRSP